MGEARAEILTCGQTTPETFNGSPLAVRIQVNVVDPS